VKYTTTRSSVPGNPTTDFENDLVDFNFDSAVDEEFDFGDSNKLQSFFTFPLIEVPADKTESKLEV
jgi:hypothetical protein